jgi:hypothetical protein
MKQNQSIIPLALAAQKTGRAISELRQLVDNGEIPAANMSGEIYLYERDVITLTPKEQTPEWKSVAHLADSAIGMSQAASKYGVSQPLIHGWVGRGLVKKMGRDPGHSQRVLVNEADVAYLASLFKKHGGKGKRVFAPGGALRVKAQ